jgi:hypothetical protein
MLENDAILRFWAAPNEALFPSDVIAKVRNVSVALLERERGLNSGPPYRKIRGRVLYRKGDVLQWMEEVAEPPEGTRPKAAQQAEAGG